VPPALAPGERLGGRYELVHRIAIGGMAEVWEAEDTVLARPVAVKVLLSHLAADDAFVTRFRREAVAAARLSHPHIVSIYDTCAGEGCEAIVMELVRGRTARELLDEEGALPVRQAVEVAAQAADALAHAHVNGLVHRDVKPGNILLSDDGRVLVADFGIAKAAEATADLTEVGQVVGTAKYLSPEQVEGRPLDARSDVYALGVVLYEMLTGRVPFSGENATATALARMTSDPLRRRQVRAGIPRAVEDVVLRAMARRPEDRYPSAEEMRNALLAIDLDRLPEDDRTSAVDVVDPTRVPDEQPSFARRERSWLVPAALIIVVALTLGIVGVLLGGTEVGGELFGTEDETPARDPEPVAISRPLSFDPEGDRSENDEELPALVDGSRDTSWHTDRYNSSSLGGLKPGVGVVLPIASSAVLRQLTIESRTSGWTVVVYAADTPGTTLADWGKPIDTVEVDGTAEIDLDGRRGAAVLLWITDVSDGGRVTIDEVQLLA